MSSDPTAFPGRSDLTIPVLTVPGPATDHQRSMDNRIGFDAMRGYLPLPAASIVARPEGVYVTVTDPDDLDTWLDKLGGVVRQSAPAAGQPPVRMLTVQTFTPPRPDGSRVPIWVTAVVVAGTPLLHRVLSAVAA